MILVPEAYRNHPDLAKHYPGVTAFYEYYEGLQEGWDGPALLVFSDGKKVGARLDRNGLRPARFWQVGWVGGGRGRAGGPGHAWSRWLARVRMGTRGGRRRLACLTLC